MSKRSAGKYLLPSIFLVSLYLHLSVFMLIALLASLNEKGCAVDDTQFPTFEVALVPEDVADRAEDKEELEKEKDLLKKEEEKEKEKDKDEKGQVVDLPTPAEEMHPEKARFLAEHDSRVKKETRGPQVPFKQGRIIPDRPLAPRPTARPPSIQERREIERKVLRLAMRAKSEVPQSRQAPSEEGDERHQPKPQPEVPQAMDQAAEQQTQPGQMQKVPSLKDLQLSDQELARAMGSRVNDYLKDVDDGEQTLLNTKRWRFATFFNRVKRQVAENWHPDVAYRRRDPTGNVYGFRDRLTILRVHLTPKGALKDLQLEKPCGVGFLDDEAMAAFRAAEPFPNPPRGLVDKETGMITFRFGFLFEISNSTGFRIFRFGN